jgi:Flp pilus assembly pilin Flp
MAWFPSRQLNRKGIQMEVFAKLFVATCETALRCSRGQTMTEYALILAAIAVVVYGTYEVLGNSIGSLASGVDSSLTNA